MKLVFSSIKNGTIFQPEFQNLTAANGTIEFRHMNTPGGIAVVYAPNGTGKSSLTRVLKIETATEEQYFSATDDAGVVITPESRAFHIIQDQVNRNVIHGKETDYLVGHQIRREYELRDKINTIFESSYKQLSDRYKTEYKVSKVTDYLLKQLETNRALPRQAFVYVRDIVNKQKHAEDMNLTEFVAFIRNDNNRPNLLQLDQPKKEWIIRDCSSDSKITKRIIEIDYRTIIVDDEINQIEQHDDAIDILRKYHSLDTCIVCDNHDFHGDALLARKQENRRLIYDSLDQNTKEILDKVVKDKGLLISDPFDIKHIVSSFIEGGMETELLALQAELQQYITAICNEMIDALFHYFDGTSFFEDYDNFVRLTQITPVLDTEELMLIEEIVSENIGKNITIERDQESRNYRLKIGEKNLLGIKREDMELSSGEQNFISLAFELLLARHSDKDYVVIDDPISSFDSMYKNKIAYCLIKFLEGKKQIILTHNTDLIRLLDVQLNNCFNLYILGNAEQGQNGFIPVNNQERALLINLHELIKFFQDKSNRDRGDITLTSAIIDRRQFLMSMIPFMRGYAHISLDLDDDFGRLSSIMHGYGTGSLDVVPIYEKLFGYSFGGNEIISVEDVLNIDCNNINILNEDQFPLLSNTLKQTLIYYHLRMKVEKELNDSFRLNAQEMDMLSTIIRRAFPPNRDADERSENRSFRVFFTSRKTLLNEFNHFEGNMNIFQPAIDITPAALRKEIIDIENKLREASTYAELIL